MACDDGTLTDDSPMKQWADLLTQAFAGYGASVDSALNYPQQLAEQGFVDIVAVQEKWPTNRWPKNKKYKQIGRHFVNTPETQGLIECSLAGVYANLNKRHLDAGEHHNWNCWHELRPLYTSQV